MNIELEGARAGRYGRRRFTPLRGGEYYRGPESVRP